MEDHPSLPPRCGRDYEIQEVLGQGQTGVVYRAMQRSLGRMVALKIPRPEVFSGKNPLKRFMEEARVTSSLDHPGIVIVLDYDLEEGIPWIVYEFVEGPDLRTIMRQTPPGIRQSLDLGMQVSKALDEAHRRGIFHRDIKPENILRCAPDTYKIADFGIAKWAGTEVKTETGILVGSLNYISPERILGAEGAAAADIYSVGVMLFELLTGRRPFEADIPGALLGHHLRTTPPRPSTINPRVSSSLDKVVLKALAKKPEDRFPGTLDLAENLEIVLSNDYQIDGVSSGAIEARLDPKTAALSEKTAVLHPSQAEERAVARAERRLDAAAPETEPGKSPRSPAAASALVGVLLGAALMLSRRPAAPVPDPTPTQAAPRATPSERAAPSDFRQVIPGAHSLTLEMVHVPGGEFLMGSPEGEGHPYEKPQHRVQVPSFHLSRFEVTRSQYFELMPAKDAERLDGRIPMTPVILAEAEAYCRKLAQASGRPYRLPTEAEWEYACRGGTRTRYFFGDDAEDLEKYAWYDPRAQKTRDSLRGHPGGQKRPNPFGLHDMLGNVFEWTADDWHDDYTGAPGDGSAWFASGGDVSSRGVLRGGSDDSNADYCRVYTRFRGFSPSHPEVYLSPVIGFRVACSIE